MKKYVLLILTLLWMAFIFYFSSRTAELSSDQSMFITERIIRIFIENPSALVLDTFETFVRKAAHFTEYFILGAFVFFTAKAFNQD